MSYAIEWNEDIPVAETVDVNDLDDHMRDTKKAIAERFQVWAWDNDARWLSLANPVFLLAAEKTVTETVSGAYTANIENGNAFDLYLTADTAITLAGSTTNGAHRITIKINPNGHTVSFTNTVKYPHGMDDIPASNFIIQLMTVDGGTTWFEVGTIEV